MDLFVIGYPKSGTTWLHRILGKSIPQVSMGVGEYKVEYTDEPVIWKRHWTVKEAKEHDIDLKKVIYIVRDPRDLVISTCAHLFFDNSPSANLHERIDETIDIMINGKYEGTLFSNQVYSSWMEHVLDWGDTLVPFIRYEDMVTNARKEISNILWHWGIEQPSNLADVIKSEAIEEKRKELYKKYEESNSPADLYNYRFLRSGIVGQWRDTLTKEQEERLTKELGYVMKRLEYQ